MSVDGEGRLMFGGGCVWILSADRVHRVVEGLFRERNAVIGVCIMCELELDSRTC